MNSRRKFLKLSTLFGAGGLVTACSDNFNVKTNELLAVKKLSFRGVTKSKINFLIPKYIT